MAESFPSKPDFSEFVKNVEITSVGAEIAPGRDVIYVVPTEGETLKVVNDLLDEVTKCHQEIDKTKNKEMDIRTSWLREREELFHKLDEQRIKIRDLTTENKALIENCEDLARNRQEAAKELAAALANVSWVREREELLRKLDEQRTEIHDKTTGNRALVENVTNLVEEIKRRDELYLNVVKERDAQKVTIQELLRVQEARAEALRDSRKESEENARIIAWLRKDHDKLYDEREEAKNLVNSYIVKEAERERLLAIAISDKEAARADLDKMLDYNREHCAMHVKREKLAKEILQRLCDGIAKMDGSVTAELRAIIFEMEHVEKYREIRFALNP